MMELLRATGTGLQQRRGGSLRWDRFLLFGARRRAGGGIVVRECAGITAGGFGESMRGVGAPFSL